SSGVRYGMFVAFKHGNQTLTDALAARLGSRLQLGRRVVELVQQDERFVVRLQSAEPMLADAVIFAAPARLMAPALRPLDAALAQQLASIRFGSTATVAYAFRREAIAHALDGFGFVVPSIERRRILASTWASKKFSGRAPAGKVLLRAFFGGAHDPTAPELDDRELVELGLSELDALLGVREA